MTNYHDESDEPVNQDDQEQPDQLAPAEDEVDGNKAPEQEKPDGDDQAQSPSSGPEPYHPEDTLADAIEITKEILSHFPRIENPTVDGEVENNTIWVRIDGDPSGRLIGRRGQTIDALQHVLSKIISHKLRKRVTINVDVESYKKRQREKLEALAVQTADYVARTSEPRALDPMSPAERRFVHLILKPREDVLTASEGMEPDRFVVIWPNDDEEEE